MTVVVKISILLLANFFFSIAKPLPEYLIVFGDSFSDNGVNMLGDNDGFRQYSTGPVWPEYLAKLLHFNLMDHAYSGAKSGLGNYNFPQPWSGVLWQVQQYLQTSGYNQIPLNHLIIFQTGGSNDLAAYDFNATQILENNAAALKSLIDHKAPRIVVLNLPDLSILPIAKQLPPEYLSRFAKISHAVNAGLEEFIKSNPNARIDYFDAANFLRKAVAAFSHNEPFIYQNNTKLKPGDIFEYSFYDEWHPATGVHYLLAIELTNVIGNMNGAAIIQTRFLLIPIVILSCILS